MKINPILKKDVKVSARSFKICLEITIYELILMLVFLIALSIIFSAGGYRNGMAERYRSLQSMFPILSIMQIGIVGLVTPIITASSITGEKERQTFDIMLTTAMKPSGIIWGKVFSAVAKILLFVVGSIPFMALSFILGGMSWLNLVWFLLAITMYALFSGSIGIFCSSLCKKSISAIILSYVFYVLIYGATFLPMIIMAIYYEINENRVIGNDQYGITPLFLLANPFIFFEEMYVHMIGGDGVDTMLADMFDGIYMKADPFTMWLLKTKWGWTLLSAAIFIVLTIVFVVGASRLITPVKKIKNGKN